MTPRRLFVEQVLPSLASFKAGYADREVGLGRDIARGADLADLLVNLPDYLLRTQPVPAAIATFANARAYREQVAWRAQPNYELACDFANSWKHRNVTRENRRMNGMADVEEAYAMCRFTDGDGTYYASHKLVLIKTVDGKYADLRRVLVSSTHFWAIELSRLGLIPDTPPHLFEFGEYTSRNEALKLAPLRFHGIVGEPLRYAARAFDFDGSLQAWVDVQPQSGFAYDMPCEFEIAPSPFAQ